MRILTMGYNGDGLRAWKQSSSGRTHFLYDGAEPVCELNASGSGSAADPFGYGAEFGYYTDHETGLVLLTHRYYDPATATFLTRDPIGYAGGINLYGYVGNNPVHWLDPEGFQAGEGVAIVLGSAVAKNPTVQKVVGNAIAGVAGAVCGAAVGLWERMHHSDADDSHSSSAEGNGHDTADDFWPNGKPKSSYNDDGSPKATPPKTRSGRNQGHPNGEEHSRAPKGGGNQRGGNSRGKRR